MPRAGRTCIDCPAVITTGNRCATCTAKRDKARGTATQRGYTSAGHQRFRKAVLARDPVCTICRRAWSTVADHYPISRRELEATGQNPNDPARGRGLCVTCHNRSTAIEHSGWA
ncbi:MAG TPA: hypothetical protein VG650_13460 [Mycobacteriales bacterium]|nr:hypothetical protein [Mycobacteriales bacterium]